MACLILFLLDPAAALGRHPPGHMKPQCFGLVAALLQGVSCAVRNHQPPSGSALTRLHLPVWSSSSSCLVRIQPACAFTPELLPLSDPLRHLSVPVRACSVADAVGGWHVARTVLSLSLSCIHVSGIPCLLSTGLQR